MKVLILAAGYGTRLEQDLKSAVDTVHKRLVGVPKPLLPLGNKVLLDYWMELIAATESEELNGIYISTNAANHGLFVAWAQAWPRVQLFCDGSTCNEERSGAVGCMKLTVDHFNVDDDLLVIGGDTVFKQGFQLQPLLDRFSEINKHSGGADLLFYVTCQDEDVNKHGILETDDSNRVTLFLEKPSPQETASRKECPCLYILSKQSVQLLNDFLVSKQDAPLSERDAPGNFIRYLISRRPVYAVEVAGRFDVGNLRSYLACSEYFMQSSQQ